ncbi:unnamed protein product [Lactuca virosa]|uniref:DNA replication factor RFC1 C-terminal domain-containing protein n=1 Tax=Lactuca virosa TaxID=75947 RepID=A0AAU9N296_9ASTR|nr:unnamed protein product [Lactuca virosa]
MRTRPDDATTPISCQAFISDIDTAVDSTPADDSIIGKIFDFHHRWTIFTGRMRQNETSPLPTHNRVKINIHGSYLPFSQSNSAATSPSVPRSPGRPDNLPSPGSKWKKGKLLGRVMKKLRMDERFDLSMSDTDLVPILIQENYINYRPSIAGKDDNGVKRLNLIAHVADSIASGDIIKDEGVEKVVEFMDAYSISQEDFESLMLMSKFQGRPNLLEGVQPAVKAALTKAYNKGSKTRVIRIADLITLPGINKAPKNGFKQC